MRQMFQSAAAVSLMSALGTGIVVGATGHDAFDDEWASNAFLSETRFQSFGAQTEATDSRHYEADQLYAPVTLMLAATDPEADQAAGMGAADGPGGPGGMSMDEAARQSSNPLGGNFWILLNQFDNYFLQGDATNKTRQINTGPSSPWCPSR